MTRNTPAEETGWRDRLDISCWREQLTLFISAGAKNLSVSLFLFLLSLNSVVLSCELSDQTWRGRRFTLLWHCGREGESKERRYHSDAVSSALSVKSSNTTGDIFNRGTLTSPDQVRRSDVTDNRCVLDSDNNVNAFKVWTKYYVW